MQESNKVATLDKFETPTGMIPLQEASMLLLEQMKHVKNNPSAIPEAQCMVDIAGRICDIAKAQVEQGELINKMIRTKNGI